MGVRPTGSYWGGGGENIDMRSGNLNFSIPLLKVKGRGWTVPFNLSYNSQNWRQDSGGTRNLRRDRGYGYGWNLQGGALLPEYNGSFSLDHYLFIGATGAEYRLTFSAAADLRPTTISAVCTTPTGTHRTPTIIRSESACGSRVPPRAGTRLRLF